MEKKLASTKEVAAFLGIGRSLTLKLISTGEIQSIKLGRRVLVPIAALEKTIAAKCAEQ